MAETITCPACKGDGKTHSLGLTHDKPCPACKGEGKVPKPE